MNIKKKKVLIFIYWNIVYRLLCILPLKKQIFFESFLGKNFSSTPKYIYNYLRENNNGNFKYVLSIRNANQFEHFDKLKVVEKTSLKYLYYLATSKYIVNNSRMPEGFKKRENQIYFQTWHGTPLKKLVYDMENVELPNVDKKKYYENFSKDVSMWDYLLASNDYSEKIFRSAFKYDGEIINTLYPQIEKLLEMNLEDNINIKRKLNIPKDHKVILYCPTFRDNEYTKKGHYIQNINIDINKIKEKLGSQKITLIIRTHYLVKEVKYKSTDGCNNIIDLSNYSDINDLYFIADMLITDYSSVFFEYMYLYRPIIFYQYDQENYKNNLRDFYVPMSDLPGTIVLDEDELYEQIRNKFHKTDTKIEGFLLKYKVGSNKINSLKYIAQKVFENE